MFSVVAASACVRAVCVYVCTSPGLLSKPSLFNVLPLCVLACFCLCCTSSCSFIYDPIWARVLFIYLFIYIPTGLTLPLSRLTNGRVSWGKVLKYRPCLGEQAVRFSRIASVRARNVALGSTWEWQH